MQPWGRPCGDGGLGEDRAIMTGGGPIFERRLPQETPVRGSASSTLPRRSGLEPVLADLVEELPAADAEAFGGPGAVAAAGEQGALDGPALDLGQEGAEGKRRIGLVGLGGDGRVGGGLVDVEVLGQDGAAARGDRGAGQGVLELADVARPGASTRSPRAPRGSATGRPSRTSAPARRRICSARGGMSSGRSRSGGIAIRTTFRR